MPAPTPLLARRAARSPALRLELVAVEVGERHHVDEQLFVGRVDAVDVEDARVVVCVHDSKKTSAPLKSRCFEPLFVDLVSPAH